MTDKGFLCLVGRRNIDWLDEHRLAGRQQDGLDWDWERQRWAGFTCKTSSPSTKHGLRHSMRPRHPVPQQLLVSVPALRQDSLGRSTTQSRSQRLRSIHRRARCTTPTRDRSSTRTRGCQSACPSPTWLQRQKVSPRNSVNCSSTSRQPRLRDTTASSPSRTYRLLSSNSRCRLQVELEPELVWGWT